MSPMAQVVEPIRPRSLVQMQEMLFEAHRRHIEPPVEPVCGKCNRVMREEEKRIIVSSDFRCQECFAKLVRQRSNDFGVSESPTDLEIKNLIHPYEHKCVRNLYILKKQPAFLPVNGPAPCA